VLKTCAEIAAIKGVSKQAANKYILKANIPPSGAKGKYKTYDCTKEPLAGYLATSAKDKKPPAPPSEPFFAETSSVPAELVKDAVCYTPRPLNEFFSREYPGRKASEALYAKALTYADKNQDAAAIFKMGQTAAKEEADEILFRQAIKTEQAKEQIAQGRAERIRLENEIRRGGYMHKSTVKLIFGKQYAIDTSVLMPLGLKLADMIDALPPSADRRDKIKKLINDEIYSALESKKRILAENIQDWEESA